MQKKLLNTQKRCCEIRGWKKNYKIIKYLRKNKINVMGHLGILPQSHKGKFRYKGKTTKERKYIIRCNFTSKKWSIFNSIRMH